MNENKKERKKDCRNDSSQSRIDIIREFYFILFYFILFIYLFIFCVCVCLFVFEPAFQYIFFISVQRRINVV